MRKYAFWLSLLLIFMIPWEDTVIVAGIGRISRVVGLGVAAFWAGTVITSGRLRQLRPFHLAFFLLLTWSGLTALWSVDLDVTLSRVTTYIQLGIMIWLIWDLYLTPAAVKAGLQAYVFGAYVSVIDTISNYLAGISRGSTPRYAASGFNANGMAMVLVLGLPLAWYLAVSLQSDNSKTERILRIINFVYIPAAVFAILLTSSRTALFSIIPIAWFILSSFVRMKPITRLLLAVGLIAALYVIQPLVPQTSIDRLATTEEELTEGDLSGRAEIWREGKEVFWDYPILGTGGGTFKEVVAFKDKTAHNMYLTLLVETGLLGLLLFLSVVILAVYHVRYLPKGEAGLWLAVILAWAIGNYTMSWEMKKHTWLFVSLIVVSANLYLPRETTAQPAPSIPELST